MQKDIKILFQFIFLIKLSTHETFDEYKHKLNSFDKAVYNHTPLYIDIHLCSIYLIFSPLDYVFINACSGSSILH